MRNVNTFIQTWSVIENYHILMRTKKATFFKRELFSHQKPTIFNYYLTLNVIISPCKHNFAISCKCLNSIIQMTAIKPFICRSRQPAQYLITSETVLNNHFIASFNWNDNLFQIALWELRIQCAYNAINFISFSVNSNESECGAGRLFCLDVWCQWRLSVKAIDFYFVYYFLA